MDFEVLSEAKPPKRTALLDYVTWLHLWWQVDLKKEYCDNKYRY